MTDLEKFELALRWTLERALPKETESPFMHGLRILLEEVTEINRAVVDGTPPDDVMRGMLEVARLT